MGSDFARDNETNETIGDKANSKQKKKFIFLVLQIENFRENEVQNIKKICNFLLKEDRILTWDFWNDRKSYRDEQGFDSTAQEAVQEIMEEVVEDNAKAQENIDQEARFTSTNQEARFTSTDQEARFTSTDQDLNHRDQEQTSTDILLNYYSLEIVKCKKLLKNGTC